MLHAPCSMLPSYLLDRGGRWMTYISDSNTRNRDSLLAATLDISKAREVILNYDCT
jgi:hypothetical protein